MSALNARRFSHFTERNHRKYPISKWGCEGSSGHNEFSQSFFSSASSDGVSDASIFATCVVPLELRGKDTKRVYWKNERPSSTKWCRLLSFISAKETTPLTLDQIKKTEDEIRDLTPSAHSRGEKSFEITHDSSLSVIDEKVLNAILENRATNTCPLFHAKPSEINNIDQIRTEHVPKETLQFGVSPLHARISSMQCILNIASNMFGSSPSWSVLQQIDRNEKGAWKRCEPISKNISVSRSVLRKPARGAATMAIPRGSSSPITRNPLELLELMKSLFADYISF